MIDDVTALVLTFNESPNLARCLERLRWVRRVIVLDSFSTDDTLSIARSFPNVEVHQRAFDTFAGQCNSGLSLITSPWVLSMDCDYVLGDGFEAEVASLLTAGGTEGYQVAFRYCIEGTPLCASLYPPRTILYRKEAAHYEDEGHGHRVRINGQVKMMRTKVDHDDRKSLTWWLSSQIKYAVREAEFLVKGDEAAQGRMDRLRARAWIMPILAPIYCLLWKGLWRSGLAGWHYTLQRWLAECIIALAVVDVRLKLRNSK